MVIPLTIEVLSARTEYVPLEVTGIEGVVAPVLQVYVTPGDGVGFRISVTPEHIVVSGPILITGTALVTEIASWNGQEYIREIVSDWVCVVVVVVGNTIKLVVCVSTGPVDH